MVGEKVYLDDASVIFKGICKLTFSSTERILPMRFLYVGCGRVGPTRGGGGGSADLLAAGRSMTS